MKLCKKCNIEHEDIKFSKNGKICQDCKDLKKKQDAIDYKKNNPDKVKSWRKTYNQTHPEKIKANTKKWAKTNKEKHSKLCLTSLNSYMKYTNYHVIKLSPYEECRQDPNNLELLQVKCKGCNKWFNPTRDKVYTRLKCLYKKTGGTSFFYHSKKCKDNYKIDIDFKKTKITYKKYRSIVTVLTKKRYKKFKYIINPYNFNIGLYEYHIDHIYSCRYGFMNKLPPDIIANPFNLRILWWEDNIKKSKKCACSLDELMTGFKEFKKFI